MPSSGIVARPHAKKPQKKKEKKAGKKNLRSLVLAAPACGPSQSQKGGAVRSCRGQWVSPGSFRLPLQNRLHSPSSASGGPSALLSPSCCYLLNSIFFALSTPLFIATRRSFIHFSFTTTSSWCLPAAAARSFPHSSSSSSLILSFFLTVLISDRMRPPLLSDVDFGGRSTWPALSP